MIRAIAVAPYDSIIVPIDPDGYIEHALPSAAAMSRAHGAQLIAVGRPDVVEPRRELIENFAGGPVDEHFLSPSEEPEVGIADVVCRYRKPLTVMATHARGRIGYALSAGSVAEDVLRARVCPVLLIGPECDPNWAPGTGAVAVAGTDLSEQALPWPVIGPAPSTHR